MDENLSKTYLEELDKSDKPDRLLVEFYCKAFELANTNSILIMFRKLLKMYGRHTIFMALLDVYDVDKLDKTNPYPLIVYFIKKRLESKVQPITYLTPDARLFKVKRSRKNMDLSNPLEDDSGG